MGFWCHVSKAVIINENVLRIFVFDRSAYLTTMNKLGFNEYKLRMLSLMIVFYLRIAYS